MLNTSIVQGRLGKDIELRYSTGEKATAIGRFSLGVTRNYKAPNGSYETDWISCVAFGKTAENMDKFFHKGDMVIVSGRLQTGSYTNKEGAKVYTTDLVVNEFQFCGGKREQSDHSSNSASQESTDGFMNIPDGVEEELPFS